MAVMAEAPAIRRGFQAVQTLELVAEACVLLAVLCPFLHCHWLAAVITSTTCVMTGFRRWQAFPAALGLGLVWLAGLPTTVALVGADTVRLAPHPGPRPPACTAGGTRLAVGGARLARRARACPPRAALHARPGWVG